MTIKTGWFYRKYIFEKSLDLTDARFRLIQGVGPILRVSDRVAQFEWVSVSNQKPSLWTPHFVPC